MYVYVWRQVIRYHKNKILIHPLTIAFDLNYLKTQIIDFKITSLLHSFHEDICFFFFKEFIIKKKIKKRWRSQNMILV